MEKENQINGAQAALVQVGMVALQSLLRELPGAITHVRALIAVKEPTADDFAKARAAIEADTVESLVPNAAKFKTA